MIDRDVSAAVEHASVRNLAAADIDEDFAFEIKPQGLRLHELAHMADVGVVEGEDRVARMAAEDEAAGFMCETVFYPAEHFRCE